MKRSNGIIVYRGASKLDGTPIVAILTGLERPSANVKTGKSVQLWILPDPALFGMPHEAAASGHDAGACGGCQHRPANNGTCYVTLFQGPRAVADAYLRGVYPDLSQNLGSLEPLFNRAYGKGTRLLRLGAYGDPMALQRDLIGTLYRAWRATGKGARHTGYTHQWREDDSYRTYLMASADSPSDRTLAHRRGWRTFHVLPLDAEPEGRDVICPATIRDDVSCSTCGACDGHDGRPSRVSIAVHVHGSKAKAF